MEPSFDRSLQPGVSINIQSSHAGVKTEKEEPETSKEDSIYHHEQLSEDDLSSHLSRFREAVTRISEPEEKAIEKMKAFTEDLTSQFNYLLDMAEQPEYDLDAFVSQAQAFIRHGSQGFLSLKGTVEELTLAMQKEEQTSKHLKKRPFQEPPAY